MTGICFVAMMSVSLSSQPEEQKLLVLPDMRLTGVKKLRARGQGAVKVRGGAMTALPQLPIAYFWQVVGPSNIWGIEIQIESNWEAGWVQRESSGNPAGSPKHPAFRRSCRLLS